MSSSSSSSSRPTKRPKPTATPSTSHGTNPRPLAHSSFLSLKAEVERAKHDPSSGRAVPIPVPVPSSSSSRSLPAHLLPPHSEGRTKPRDRSRLSSARPAASSSAHDAARLRTNLERKAAIYDRLRRGLHGGVSSETLYDGPIDWTRKATEHDPDADPASPPRSDLDPGETEPIEFIDEFGRTRVALLRDVPREFVPVHLGGDLQPVDPAAEHDTAVYGPATSFPVYVPARPPDRTGRGAKAAADAAQQRHFDAEWEVRYRGAGFYRFSADEHEREAQMEALRRGRGETEARRRSEGQGGTSGREKRRRRVQERSEVVERVRRRVLGEEAVERRRERLQRARLESVLAGVERV